MTPLVTAVALGVLAVAAWLLQDLAADIPTPTVEEEREAAERKAHARSRDAHVTRNAEGR